MSEDIVLNRASQSFNKEDFCSLAHLVRTYQWLENSDAALFELWTMADDEQQKNLIKSLIEKFLYIDDRKLTESSRLISNEITNVWMLEPEDTIISATCNNTRPDGSQMLVQVIKNKFTEDWKVHNFYNSMPQALQKIRSNGNIVLVDDFIGTGNTIERLVKYIKKIISEKELTNVRVFFVSVAAMEFAKTKLDTLNITYYSANWLKKGISDEFNGADFDVAKLSMDALELKLSTNYSSATLPSWGYGKSETLFCISNYNIPNNVFPIFWWKLYKNGKRRNTLFNRV